MARPRPRGVLERTAEEDLEKDTLSRIPTVYGRLNYLATLRDRNSGVYHHHGLTQAFGAKESLQAMRIWHERVFREWMDLSLPEKYDDLTRYLASLDQPQWTIVNHWLRSRVHRLHAPESANDFESRLF